jgi:Rv2525c-like, glycoside hydrolase-like domain
VTATHQANERQILAILASAGLPAPVIQNPAAMASRSAPVAGVPRRVTNFTGRGFDACTAPGPQAMQAWLAHSRYQAVGIYIGGSDVACAQPNLTAAWVSQQAAAGWHFIRIYSSSDSGVTDLVDNYANPTLTMPDVIFDAWRNGVANTFDPTIPALDWVGHRRVHQYAGNVTQTHGGVRINIDRDFLDVHFRRRGWVAAPSSCPDQPRPGWPAVPGDVIGECGQLFVEGRRREAFYAANTGDAGWHGPRPGSPWTGPGGLGGG